MSLLSDKMTALDKEMGGDLGARITQIADAMADGTHPSLRGLQPPVVVDERTKVRLAFILATIEGGWIRPESPHDMRALLKWADDITEVALTE